MTDPVYIGNEDNVPAQCNGNLREVFRGFDRFRQTFKDNVNVVAKYEVPAGKAIGLARGAYYVSNGEGLLSYMGGNAISPIHNREKFLLSTDRNYQLIASSASQLEVFAFYTSRDLPNMLGEDMDANIPQVILSSEAIKRLGGLDQVTRSYFPGDKIAGNHQHVPVFVDDANPDAGRIEKNEIIYVNKGKLRICRKGFGETWPRCEIVREGYELYLPAGEAHALCNVSENGATADIMEFTNMKFNPDNGMRGVEKVVVCGPDCKKKKE